MPWQVKISIFWCHFTVCDTALDASVFMFTGVWCLCPPNIQSRAGVHLCQLLWSRWILRRGQLIWICRVVSPDNNNHSALCGVSEAVGGEPARPGGRLQRSGGEKWSECQSRGGSGERERVWHVTMWGTDQAWGGSAEDNNIILWQWSRSPDTDTRGVRPQWWTRGLAEERV